MNRETNWGWNSPNCWAGVIGCVAATAFALFGANEATFDLAANLLPEWMPGRVQVLGIAILGGASGLIGAQLVDVLRPPDR